MVLPNIVVKAATAFGLRWTSRKRAAPLPTTFDRRSKGVIDPSVTSTPEMQKLGRLRSFAAQLEANINAADSQDAPGSSERRMAFMQRQRRALLMIDDALREATGRAYDPNRWLNGAIQDYIRQQRQNGSSQ